VTRNMALAFEESGECRRQLVVNEEFHTPHSTAWSA
jgi:hypothetical protein